MAPYGSPEWRHAFVEPMIRRGVPSDLLRRTLRELEDHHADLREEMLDAGLGGEEANHAADERLGTPSDLAAHWLQRRRRVHWGGRHPLVFFGVGPLVLLLLCWAGATVYVGSIGHYFGWWDGGAPSLNPWRVMLTIAVELLQFALTAGLPLIYCRLSRQFGVSWRWALLACAVLSAHAALHTVRVEFPVMGDDGMLLWGYGVSITPAMSQRLGAALVPWLLGATYWFLARRWSRRILHQFQSQSV